MEYQEFVARNNENKARYSQQKKFASKTDPILLQASWRIHHVEQMGGMDYVQLDNNAVDYQSMRPDVTSLVAQIFSTPLFHVSNPSALRSYDWNKVHYWADDAPDIFGTR